MTLIGRSETLRLPGVEEVEDRQAEKNPPSLRARMLEEAVFHRPLESRPHPMEGFTLEPKPSTLEEAAEGATAVRGQSLPRLPEPLGSASAASGIPDLDDPGPPDGLTLDAAIERLIRCNRGLQTLQHAIPQTQADTRTAGLLGNPLVFGGATGTPYGRFSDRPGFREYPIVVGYLLDLTTPWPATTARPSSGSGGAGSASTRPSPTASSRDGRAGSPLDTIAGPRSKDSAMPSDRVGRAVLRPSRAPGSPGGPTSQEPD